MYSYHINKITDKWRRYVTIGNHYCTHKIISDYRSMMDQWVSILEHWSEEWFERRGDQRYGHHTIEKCEWQERYSQHSHLYQTLSREGTGGLPATGSAIEKSLSHCALGFALKSMQKCPLLLVCVLKGWQVMVSYLFHTWMSSAMAKMVPPLLGEASVENKKYYYTWWESVVKNTKCERQWSISHIGFQRGDAWRGMLWARA